jgi:hypothetical protein
MRGATQVRQPNELAPAEYRIKKICCVDETATSRASRPSPECQQLALIARMLLPMIVVVYQSWHHALYESQFKTVAQTIACMLEKNQARMKKSNSFLLESTNPLLRIIFSHPICSERAIQHLATSIIPTDVSQCPANTTSNFSFAR